MQRRSLLLAPLLAAATPALAQLKWIEGAQYKLLSGSQRVGAPDDRIEVTEVFSYGCVFCYRAKDAMAKLAASLPADAEMTYVHASFMPTESWPLLQRAYYTALELGIAAQNHDAVFKAIWETHEIPLLDAASGTMRRPPPTLADVANFYARVAAVKAEDFVATSASPAVQAHIQRADELVKLWRIPGTPAVVVNGRYLIDNGLLSGWDEMVSLAGYLIGLERARLKKQ